MNIFIIIALIGVIALAFVWPRKSPALKRTSARTWPPGRGKPRLKPKPTSP